jgi:Zn finger protein HypA/HybF involved in hydrogenase expression
MSEEETKTKTTFCYQCDAEVEYLYWDYRCIKCTRITPEEMV